MSQDLAMRRGQLLLEPIRAVTEAALLPSAAPVLSMAPRGDGRTVLVLPGFTAGDGSTTGLRLWLSMMGYRSRPWGIGRNRGVATSLRELTPSFLKMTDQLEQPISMVGWSLGGTIARQLARQYPDRIRDVVTLGSPLGTNRPAFDGGRPVSVLTAPPAVPCTAIFSRTDAIVPASIAEDVDFENSESIEVCASHIGLGFNAGVYYAVADRLAAPTEQRERFKAPALLTPYFPSRRAA